VNVSEFFATANNIITVLGAIFSLLSFVLVAWLSGRFVKIKTHDELVAKVSELEKTNAALEKALTQNDNEEARKRRDLQERVARMEERVNHLPTSEQVQSILIKLGEATASLASVDGRLDDMQDTLRREVDSVKDLVGSVQETMRMIQRGGRP